MLGAVLHSFGAVLTLVQFWRSFGACSVLAQSGCSFGAVLALGAILAQF